jgi:hypothetical protein
VLMSNMMCGRGYSLKWNSNISQIHVSFSIVPNFLGFPLLKLISLCNPSGLVMLMLPNLFTFQVFSKLSEQRFPSELELQELIGNRLQDYKFGENQESQFGEDLDSQSVENLDSQYGENLEFQFEENPEEVSYLR